MMATESLINVTALPLFPVITLFSTSTLPVEFRGIEIAQAGLPGDSAKHRDAGTEEGRRERRPGNVASQPHGDHHGCLHAEDSIEAVIEAVNTELRLKPEMVAAG